MLLYILITALAYFVFYWIVRLAVRHGIRDTSVPHRRVGSAARTTRKAYLVAVLDNFLGNSVLSDKSSSFGAIDEQTDSTLAGKADGPARVRSRREKERAPSINCGNACQLPNWSDANSSGVILHRDCCTIR